MTSRLHSPMGLLLAGVAVAAALTLSACGSSEAAEEPAARAAQADAGQTAHQAGGFRLARVKDLGDALYVYVTAAPEQPNRLYLVAQSGTVRVLQRGKLVGAPFLDVSGTVTAGGEQGLLGLAFHPDYARNGRLFVYYTDSSGDNRVVEFRRGANGRADPGSGRVLLSMPDKYANHNGGNLVFGADGFLYIGTGDGGSGGDPDGNGQNRDALLGKILRIDVDSRADGKQYSIPPGNPFAGGGGGAPEVYSYGLRNPWRFSFDRTRGDLWIGDVGQENIEEIDYRPKGRGAGANFGWNAFEGRSAYDGGGRIQGSAPVAPVAQYTHALGCSVTGGYVYRGTRVPALRGRYVFADFCDGRVWTMRAGPKPGPKRNDTARLGVTLSNITSFGEGLKGELYMLANGSLYRFVRR